MPPPDLEALHVVARESDRRSEWRTGALRLLGLRKFFLAPGTGCHGEWDRRGGLLRMKQFCPST